MNSTDIIADEEARQALVAMARRREAAVNVVTNLRRVVEHTEARLAPYRAQLKLYDALDKLVVQIDPGIQGVASYMVRDIAIKNLCMARADQQRRLDNTDKDLAENRRKLADAEKIVAEFDA